jgi:hypothetical protein
VYLTVAIVLGLYCVVPLPLSRQLLVAVPFCVATLCIALRWDRSIAIVLGGAYVLSNAIGIVVSAELNRRRRLIFAGALRETELRRHLEKALAEVRTLRGLLCICAWCKRIRGDADEWQSVVQRRTDAKFTHSICPECMRSHFQVENTAHDARAFSKMPTHSP